LKRKTAKISVSAIQNNAEAYQFAQDWYDTFKAAGWTMMDDRVRVFLVGGRPNRGIFVRIHGATIPTAGSFEISRDSPVGALAESLEVLGVARQLQAQRFPDMAQDQLSFEINEHPEN